MLNKLKITIIKKNNKKIGIYLIINFKILDYYYVIVVVMARKSMHSKKIFFFN